MSSVRSFEYDDATTELTMELPATQDMPADDEPYIAPSSPVARAAKIAPARPVTVGLQPQQRKELVKESVLCGRYVLEDPIGVGGTSVVFRARDLRREVDGAGGTKIALKTLRPELDSRPQAIERLKREFRLAQALTHPHVVRVFDLDNEDGHWFMTMELLEGKTLSAALAQSPFSNGQPPFTARRAIDILRACGEALAYAHDHGVVHGDFKPGNIFLPLAGPLRVLDFGSATSVEPSLEPHAPAATACYASPEVLSGQRPDRRDDIFSFACVAYELLGGMHPFERRSSLEARNSGWKPLRNWNLTDRQWLALEEALLFKREARTSNMRALLSALFPSILNDRIEVPDRLEFAEPAQSAPEMAPMMIAPLDLPLDQQKKQTRSSFTAVAALLALVLAATVVYFQMNRHPEAMESLRVQSVQWFDYAREAVQTQLAAWSASTDVPKESAQPAPAALTAIEPLATATAANETAGLVPATAKPIAPALAAAPQVSERASRARTQPQAPFVPEAFVSFAQESITVDEGANSAVLALRRDGNIDGRTHVAWRVTGGTARAGQDYIYGASGLAVFADGQTSRSIYIPLLRDSIEEPDKEFFVELYDPATGTQVWPTARAQVVIRDDD